MSKTCTQEQRNIFTTQTAIRRWGNSQGIRLSKEVMTKMGFEEDDKIKLSIDNGKMLIEKVNKPKYLNLRERLEDFYKKPIDEIYVESTQEVDVGNPIGKELW